MHKAGYTCPVGALGLYLVGGGGIGVDLILLLFNFLAI